MGNNIDENIRILKRLKDKRWESYTRPNIFTLEFEEKKSIDIVLSELKQLQEDLIDHEKTSFEFQELYIKTKSELETYKKIAEKLAEYMEEAGIMNKSVPINENDINSPRTVGVATMQEILDWARKEVKKDE